MQLISKAADSREEKKLTTTEATYAGKAVGSQAPVLADSP